MGSGMGWVGSRRAALVALAAVLTHVTVNYVPLEYVVAAQQSAFATGTRLSPEDAVDAAVVLGYSVEAGTPTLPLVARVHLGVRLFCSGAARNMVFSGCALPSAPAHPAPPNRLPEPSVSSPLPPRKTLTRSLPPRLSAAPPGRTPARSSPRRTPCASSPSRSSRRTIPSPRPVRALESASRSASPAASRCTPPARPPESRR